MPEIGGRAPLPIEVEAGKSYWWCACGLSKKQPFCDGSHKVTAFTPIEFKPEKEQSAPPATQINTTVTGGIVGVAGGQNVSIGSLNVGGPKPDDKLKTSPGSSE